ncbi:hypothetical protein AgCh_014849 [Apium graveolens]
MYLRGSSSDSELDMDLLEFELPPIDISLPETELDILGLCTSLAAVLLWLSFEADNLVPELSVSSHTSSPSLDVIFGPEVGSSGPDGLLKTFLECSGPEARCSGPELSTTSTPDKHGACQGPLGYSGGGPPLDTYKQSTQARRPLVPRSNGPDLEAGSYSHAGGAAGLQPPFRRCFVGTQPQLHLYGGKGSRTASDEQPRHQELSFGARRRVLHHWVSVPLDSSPSANS